MDSRLQSNWYSPTRLLSSPVDYDFPGDRFIPNRSLMDLDQAHTLLTSRSKEASTPKANNEYRRKLEENLTLDCEGRPFRMLVFRGSPKSNRKSSRLIDEMRRSDEETLYTCNNTKPQRCLPKRENRILDAPRLKDNFYMNIMDWGKSNILAIALGTMLYLWNAENAQIQILSNVTREDDYPTSVSWSEDAKLVAAGYKCSRLELWDVETCKLVRNLQGHNGRIGITAWNGHMLTSGSRDKAIINHDVRARYSLTSRIQAHASEVCGLKWSSRGNILASGGNDNRVYIWDTLRMSSSQFLHRLNDHSSAVKALAWCPYDSDVLASGGGTRDGRIKIWNVCGLEWNRHYKEILSGHGYGISSENQFGLCLWRYPSMTKLGVLPGNSSRVLHLSQSPDGLTAVAARAKEILCFWEVFGPPPANSSRVSELDSLLSLKTSPIR
ncbi:hypothetical protein RJ640_026212 [Escallonia rubra]|uniref:CDC20/Fizzy WD40 domain-containing protein n=1 Tax=Escallonia rubra TaxID=112253 RepID=A0AA88RNF3_9ASTE|nr:hypothetical protein RJ640_026212 [Escallonia rubra]